MIADKHESRLGGIIGITIGTSRLVVINCGQKEENNRKRPYRRQKVAARGGQCKDPNERTAPTSQGQCRGRVRARGTEPNDRNVVLV